MNLTPSNATDAPTPPVAPDANATPLLDHERLDAFQVALAFAAMVPALTKTARPALRDQLERAASSIALTLAEGCTPLPFVGGHRRQRGRQEVAATSAARGGFRLSRADENQ